MKAHWFSLILVTSPVVVSSGLNVTNQLVTSINHGYVSIPTYLVIDSSVKSFVDKVQDPHTDLLAYLQGLGFLVDEQVKQISYQSLNYLHDQHDSLTSLDLLLKIKTQDNTVATSHLVIPCDLFNYVIQPPAKLAMTYVAFVQALESQDNQSLLNFLSDQGFILDQQLKVTHFIYDQATRVLEIDFQDQIDQDHAYGGHTNVNLNSIAFLSENEKSIDNTGLYMSIGISVLIFVLLGIYLASFIIKMKNKKHPSQTTKQDQEDTSPSQVDNQTSLEAENQGEDPKI